MASLQAKHSRGCALVPLGHRSIERWMAAPARWARLLRNRPRRHSRHIERSLAATGEQARDWRCSDWRTRLRMATSGLGRTSGSPSGPTGGSPRSSASPRRSARTARRSSTQGGLRRPARASDRTGRHRPLQQGPSRPRLLALHPREAPARAWRLPAGGRLLPVRRLESGAGAAAGAEASARAEGGGVLRERGATSPLRAPPRRAATGRCAWSR